MEIQGSEDTHRRQTVRKRTSYIPPKGTWLLGLSELVFIYRTTKFLITMTTTSADSPRPSSPKKSTNVYYEIWKSHYPTCIESNMSLQPYFDTLLLKLNGAILLENVVLME
jgi:hypothetical protein